MRTWVEGEPYVLLGMWQWVWKGHMFFTLTPQQPRLSTGVSAFCVWRCELVQSKPLCVLHFHTYTLPTGMCGRRAALWLTWTRLLACGWIPMGPCTSLKHGRVTSEHTPAGWPQWVAMTPVAPILESGLCVFLPCLILLFLFPLIYVRLRHDGWIFSPLLWFITALLSNPSNSQIFTLQYLPVGCLILCCFSHLVYHFVPPSRMHTNIHTGSCPTLQKIQ